MEQGSPILPKGKVWSAWTSWAMVLKKTDLDRGQQSSLQGEHNILSRESLWTINLCLPLLLGAGCRVDQTNNTKKCILIFVEWEGCAMSWTQQREGSRTLDIIDQIDTRSCQVNSSVRNVQPSPLTKVLYRHVETRRNLRETVKHSPEIFVLINLVSTQPACLISRTSCLAILSSERSRKKYKEIYYQHGGKTGAWIQIFLDIIPGYHPN